MMVSKSTVARALKELKLNPLVRIHISRASCTGLSDPFPAGGPYKLHEVWGDSNGFFLKLKKDDEGTLLPGDRASFCKEEIDSWLADDDYPWIRELV